MDTQAFNAVDRSGELAPHTEYFREALDLISGGLHSGDAQLIGKGATLSALSYQQILPRPQLPAVLA